MTPKRKPCPFCGGKRLDLRRCGTMYYVACKSCRSMGGDGRTEAEAVELWNQRKEGEDDGVQDSTRAIDQ